MTTLSLRKLGLSFLLTLALPLFCLSQSTITGTVSTSTGDTLIGATVMVKSDTNIVNGAFTNESGQYSISIAEVKEGMKLVVSYVEYETFEQKLDASQKSQTIDVVLKPSIREAVVITAGRHEQKLADLTISMEVIKPKAIDIQATNEIQDVLQQAPGVDIIDDQPNIRGSSGFAFGLGSRVMVMMDGLPLLSADAAFAQFDVIPTDNVAQVEIMKGASSVLYGSSALGGVINVIMADAPKEPMTSVRAKHTIYDNTPYEGADWWWDHRPFKSSINIFHSRKVGNHDITGLIDLIKDTGFRKNTDSEEGRVQLFTKFRPKGISGLNFGANFTYRGDSSSNFLYWDSYPAGITPNSIGDSVFAGGPFTGDSTLRRQYLSRIAFDPYIKYTTPKGNTHHLRSRVLRTVNTNDTQQGARNLLWYNDYQHSMRIVQDKFNWVVGATFTYARSFSDSLFGGGQCLDNGSVEFDTNDVLRHFSYNGAAYTQIDGKILPWLNATLGGRFDFFLIDGVTFESSPVFRAGLNANSWPGGNFRASFGQAFRSPSIAERFTTTTGGGLVVTANPCLETEKGYSAEIGFRQGYKFGTRDRGAIGFIDVAGFMMDYDNMIEFGVNGVTTSEITDPGFGPLFSAINVADARITGIEFTALTSATLGDFRIDLTGGITYIQPRNLNPAPADSALDILNQDQSEWFDEFLAWVGDSLTFFGVLAVPPGVRYYDNPEFLKYRSRTMGRLSLTLGYKRLNLTANYQYKSRILAIDQFLYSPQAILGAKDYVLENGTETSLLNTIVAYDIIDGLKLSFHVNNVFNRRWVVLPGIVGQQRRYTFQVKYVF